MKKEVLILTLVGANNVGAFLQAFSIYNFLKENGYIPSFAIMPSAKSGKKSYGKLNKIKKYLFSEGIRKVLFKGKDAAIYRKARERFVYSHFDSDKEYDCVVVGSDEVWNLQNENFFHYPQYFAKDINAKCIVSYAPSSGNTTVDEIQKSGISFKGFNALSVRDKRTCDIVKAIDSREPVRVLDPTFLIENLGCYAKNFEIKKDFIMVYSYGIGGESVKKVKQFAKKVNLPLYSVGTYNKWCDKNINVSPFEFLQYMKKAKYIITSTFHGTALSINLEKQFAVYPGNSEKVLDLLESFSLSDRTFSENDDLNEIFATEIDYDSINKTLSSKRKKSQDFLLDSLME